MPFWTVEQLVGGSSGMDPLLLLRWDVRKLCWDCCSALLELRDVVSACVCVGVCGRTTDGQWTCESSLSVSELGLDDSLSI